MREEVMLVAEAVLRSLMSFFIHHLKDYSERDFQKSPWVRPHLGNTPIRDGAAAEKKIFLNWK